jgi:hypothetical protein
VALVLVEAFGDAFEQVVALGMALGVAGCGGLFGFGVPHGEPIHRSRSD